MRVEFVTNYIPNTAVFVAKGDSGEYLSVCGTHLHDDIEILIANSGLKEVEVGGDKVLISAGDVIIINRRVPHSTRDLAPYTNTSMLQFRAEKLLSGEFEHMNRYLSMLIATDARPYTFIGHEDTNAAAISELVDKMISEKERKDRNYDLFIRGYMEVLLGVLYRNNLLEDVSKNYNTEAVRRIWPVIEYIDKSYEQPLALDDLCSILNMNRHYFCRLFKKATNTTPTEYINFVRIWKAENLLITTDDSVLEISMAVGFSSVSYFNRTFKRLKNTTPTAYRHILYAKNKLI